jgi:hypothetical protein
LTLITNKILDRFDDVDSSICRLFGLQLSVKISGNITLVKLYLLTSISGVGFSLYTVFRSGITWDLNYDIRAWQNVLNIPKDATLPVLYSETPDTWEFYGLTYLQFSSFFRNLLTGLAHPIDPYDPSFYIWVGITTLFVTTIANLFYSWVLSVVFSRRSYFIFSFAILSATPIMVGLNVISSKDAFVAAGIQTVTASLALLIYLTNSEEAKLKVSRNLKHWYFGFVFVGMFIGSYLSLGTRIGSFLIVLGITITTVFLAIVYTISRTKKSKSAEIMRLLTFSISPILITIQILKNTNPFAKANFNDWFLDSILASFSYSLTGIVRTAGLDLSSQNLPNWYIVAWILVSLPIPLLLLIFAGLFTFWRDFRVTPNKVCRSLLILPFILQGLGFLAVYITLSPPDMDGLRHVYFSISGLVFFAIFAIDKINLIGNPNTLNKKLRKLVIFVMPISLVLTTLLWLPYSYSYKNLVFGGGFSADSWEKDFWGTSSKEAVLRLRNDYNISNIIVLPYGEATYAYGSSPFDVPGNRISIQKLSGGDAVMPNLIGVYSFNRFTWDKQPNSDLQSCDDFPQSSCQDFKPLQCKPVFAIRRGGYTLGTASLCILDDNLSAYEKKLFDFPKK